MLLMKREMADCLTFWQTSYNSDDFLRSWNLSFDETACTDDEGNAVTSLLDDLAEAKRHDSADDIINDADADADYLSLWDDVCDEQWTTKDCNSGPTLAELNGGELTDLEQYEPLRISPKRKRARSIVTDSSHRRGSTVGAPVQICNVSDADSLLQTVQQASISDDRSTSCDPGLQSQQETSLSLGEQQTVKRMLNPSKPNCKVYPKHSVSVSLSSQPKEDVRDKTEVSANNSERVLHFSAKHSWKSEPTDLADDLCASKRMKTNHGGLQYSLLLFVM